MEMDIELLSSCILSESKEGIKRFRAWINYKRVFARTVSRALLVFQTIINNLHVVFDYQPTKRCMTAAELENMKSRLHLDSLFKLVLNYSEILSLKLLLETTNDTKPCKVYIKSLIKTFASKDDMVKFNCSSDCFEVARGIFRDDGSIPNNIPKHPEAPYKNCREFSLIVLDEIKNIHINDVDDRTAIRIVENIHRRTNDLLKEYHFFIVEEFKSFSKIGKYTPKRYNTMKNIDGSFTRYLSEDVIKCINKRVNNKDVEFFILTEDTLHSFEEEIPAICSIESIARLIDSPDEDLNEAYFGYNSSRMYYH